MSLNVTILDNYKQWLIIELIQMLKVKNSLLNRCGNVIWENSPLIYTFNWIDTADSMIWLSLETKLTSLWMIGVRFATREGWNSHRVAYKLITLSNRARTFMRTIHGIVGKSWQMQERMALLTRHALWLWWEVTIISWWFTGTFV